MSISRNFASPAVWHINLLNVILGTYFSERSQVNGKSWLIILKAVHGDWHIMKKEEFLSRSKYFFRVNPRCPLTAIVKSGKDNGFWLQIPFPILSLPILLTNIFSVLAFSVFPNKFHVIPSSPFISAHACVLHPAHTVLFNSYHPSRPSSKFFSSRKMFHCLLYWNLPLLYISAHLIKYSILELYILILNYVLF